MFDIQSVVYVIQSVVDVRRFRSVVFDIQSVVCVIQSVVDVTFSISCV